MAALAATALLTILAVVPSPASADRGAKRAVVQLKGTVVSVKAGGRSFRLSHAGGGSVTVRVARRTRVAKNARPRAGRKLVIRAMRTRRGWIARSIRAVGPARGQKQTGAGKGKPKADDDDGADDEADDGTDLEDEFGDMVDDSSDEEE